MTPAPTPPAPKPRYPDRVARCDRCGRWYVSFPAGSRGEPCLSCAGGTVRPLPAPLPSRFNEPEEAPDA